MGVLEMGCHKHFKRRKESTPENEDPILDYIQRRQWNLPEGETTANYCVKNTWANDTLRRISAELIPHQDGRRIGPD